MTPAELRRAEIERRMILENQVAIMTGLLSLTATNQKVSSDFYYHIAKTQAYNQGTDK